MSKPSHRWARVRTLPALAAAGLLLLIYSCASELGGTYDNMTNGCTVAHWNSDELQIWDGSMNARVTSSMDSTSTIVIPETRFMEIGSADAVGPFTVGGDVQVRGILTVSSPVTITGTLWLASTARVEGAGTIRNNGTIYACGTVMVDVEGTPAEPCGPPDGETDQTPPVVTPDVSGTVGDDDWYTSDVAVTWRTSDPESPVTSTPCPATQITTDTVGQEVSCSATSTGGISSASVTAAPSCRRRAAR